MSDATREWATLLDRMEDELARPDAAAPGWRPPAARLPAELAPRARRLRDAQRARIAALTRERDEVAAQLQALRRVPATRPDTAAYVDRDG